MATKHVGALEHPVCVLGFGECVDVEDDIPFGFAAAIAVERCSPPQASNVVLVLPEVVDKSVTDRAVGDAVVRGEHLECRRLEAGVPRVCLQGAERALVLGAHPGKRFVTFHLFEPEERVGSIGWRVAIAGFGHTMNTRRQRLFEVDKGDWLRRGLV